MFAAFQTIYYYGKLPDRIASHFSVGGVADGWTLKPSLFFTYWAIIALVLGVSLGIPALIGRLPRRLINIPHKEYWLSDEKLPETLDLFRTHFRWFGVILLSLQVAVFQMVFQANLSQAPVLGRWFIIFLAGFMVAVIA
jgi:uncharacterized membrane protein